MENQVHWIVERASRDEDTDPLLRTALGRKHRIDGIALCEDGYKIIETNSISSAGLYAMDLDKYVVALNYEFSK